MPNDSDDISQRRTEYTENSKPQVRAAELHPAEDDFILTEDARNQITSISSAHREAVNANDRTSDNHRATEVTEKPVERAPTPSSIEIQSTIVITDDPNRMDADYVLLGELGRGGMGVVKLARQCSLDRLVAMKILKPNKLKHKGARDRFLMEAMVMSGLDHPGIPPVIDMGIDRDGLPFYCMKRVTGLAWADTIRDNNQRANLEILSRSCDVVAYAHSKGVIHRDLKPANVMLGEYGEIFVMDWGLAVATHAAARAGRLDASHAVAGSPSYLPPETARGDSERIDHRSDIYLLGACLFEICTRKPPHRGKDFDECLENAKNNVIRQHRYRGPLMNIALKAMATELEDRYQSVQEFQRDLDHYQEQGQSEQLTIRATELLSEAVKAQDYQTFAKACFAYEEAIDLWNDNERARDGLMQAKAFYAFAAIENLDLDLAQTLIVKGHPIFQKVEYHYHEARHKTREQEYAARQLQLVQETVEQERLRNWVTVFQSRMQANTVGLHWLFAGGSHHITDNTLVRVGGKPQVTTLRTSYTGDVRLSIQLKIPQVMNEGISLVICARKLDADHLDMYSGYRARIQFTPQPTLTLLRDGLEIAEGPIKEWDPDHWHVIELSIRLGKITAIIDNIIIHEWTDDNPLTSAERVRCGIVSWMEQCDISQARLDRLGYPLRASILELAEEHLKQGNFTTAIDLFDDALLSNAARKDASRIAQGRRQATQLQQLYDSLPEFTANLSNLWPDATLSVREGELSIDLQESVVDDLSPLRGLPIRHLSLDASLITNLSPLSELALSALTLRRYRGQDLNDLPHSIRKLTLYECHIDQLHGLEKLTLSNLCVVRCEIDSLSNIQPEKLHTLEITGSRITDISTLAHAHLSSLSIHDCNIADISCLNLSKLHQLSLSRCAVTTLPTLPELQSVHLSYLDISSLTAIADSPLVDLHLEGLALNSSENLPRLHCSHARLLNCQLTSLASLEDWPLQHLEIDDNPIGDLSPLKHMPLRHLSANRCEIDSLLPLIEIKDLLHLSIDMSTVKHPEPVELPQLRSIMCQQEHLITGAPAEQLHTQLAAWSSRNLAELQPISIEGNHYYYWPRMVSFTEANTMASTLGLVLAEIPQRSIQHSLSEHLPQNCWFGLTPMPSGLRWNFRKRIHWLPELRSRDATVDAGIWHQHYWEPCNSERRLARALFMLPVDLPLVSQP